MTLTKRDSKLIILFLLFFVIGISGVYSVDFITGNQTINTTFKWCGIPILAIAAYFAYRTIFSYDKKAAIWKKIYSLIVMAFFFSMFSFISFQGLLILFNCNVGLQKDYLLKGKIVKIHYPEKKKPGNKYSIEIKRNLEKDIIKMDVPTNEYLEGQTFTKMMKIGSLGFIYSEK